MNNKQLTNLSMTKSQSGVVLVISLIMLLALTIIGITSANVTGLEEKMAANSKDINLAFQAAEAALRDIEASITTTQPTYTYSATTCAAQGSNGVYSVVTATGTAILDGNSKPLSCYGSVDWTATSNIKYAVYSNGVTNNPKLKGVYQPPRYIIEQVSRENLGSGAASGINTIEAGTGPSTSNHFKSTMRITARGWGSNENSIVTLQSIITVTY